MGLQVNQVSRPPAEEKEGRKVRTDHALDQDLTHETSLQLTVKWQDLVLDAVRIHGPKRITIGPKLTRSKAFDLQVDGDLPPFTNAVIAQMGTDEATVWVPEGADAWCSKADRDVRCQVSSGAIVLRPSERLVFTYGTLTYSVRYQADLPPKLVPEAGPLSKDPAFSFSLLAAMLMHVGLILGFVLSPPRSPSQLQLLVRREAKFAQRVIKTVQHRRPKIIRSSGLRGAKHQGVEGQLGTELQATPKEAKPSARGTRRIDPKAQPRQQNALQAGLLGMLNKKGMTNSSRVLGPGGLGTGLSQAVGGLKSGSDGDARGSRGLGTRGTGLGGGGQSVGVGGLGPGTGRGSGRGRGAADLGGRGRGRYKIIPGKTTVLGSISREEVARVIRRNLARFRFCYEQQLNSSPNLQGKVSVKFMIAPTGRVPTADIHDSSLNHPKVEGCVAKVMRSLKFPKPKGGGVAEVTYPFFFESR